MHLFPHLTCTILVWDHCLRMFRPYKNSFLTGSRIFRIQSILVGNFPYTRLLSCHSTVPLPSMAPTAYQAWIPLLGCQGSPGSTELSLSPVLHLHFLFSHSMLSHLLRLSPSPGCPSLSFTSCLSFSVHSLHETYLTPLTSESLFHLVTEPHTLPLNYTLFCSLIVLCTYILSLNYILIFVNLEHVFFLCVLCRYGGVSNTEARLSAYPMLCLGELIWRKRMGTNKGF